MSRPPLNYTTKVPVNRTSGECLSLLAQAGADHVAVSYTDKQATGLAFVLETAHGTRSFRLPVNIEGVNSLLRRADYPSNVSTPQLSRYVTREHAARVAWRIIKDWLEAQLAIVAAEMTSLDEVMLPYLQVEGQTLFERYIANERAAIEAGAS
jgi:hypothetical protein